ncbi:PhnD/SsuA/transferrin family substrate-binding protein [Albimonas pacifica]|uniref:ABC transporter, phosphonate, substrate-binding protein n=1 Tax=Albimonas pacifica TaxID=1114924 RepID=A0A1I3FLG1_9RHOB|nr:PhnD/SsuA/transferrin family substrate-binding protein [Albimonas pacifica]SFI11987.1 ABC transporter, phosphonate, substrate-binding protein [Albimonas pacifica]
MTAAAALPLFDWPELREATDGLWAAVSQQLEKAGIEAPPLDRERRPEALWADPSLLLSQVDAQAHVAGAAAATRLICAPVYDAEGCGAGRVAAVFLVPRAQADRGGAPGLAALSGEPFAVAAGSLCGEPALVDALGRAAVGELVACPDARAAIRALAEGRARGAAVDALSWALARTHEPAAAELTAIGWSDPLPAPPFVTSALTETGTRARLRAALVEALVDPATEPFRRALHLARIVAFADPDYDPARRLATLARL